MAGSLYRHQTPLWTLISLQQLPINRVMPLVNMLQSVLQFWSFRYVLELFFACFFSRSKPSSRMSPTSWVPNRYPPTRRSEHVDVYRSASRGQVTVPDPYYWLETDSNETDKWTSAQQAFTRDYLDRNPDLERLRAAFQDCVDYQKVSSSPPLQWCLSVDNFDL